MNNEHTNDSNCSLKVLSLFDGISCGRVALARAGLNIDTYIAYEIDPYAIKISQQNYPDIIQRGDVTTANFTQYKGFDLLIGGSPCQDLSIYKTSSLEGYLGLEGNKSSLFYHYVRALKEVKPKYFLLENVASMKKEWVDVISEELGVQPIMIDSALVSAQSRRRLYWTNIPNIDTPDDRGLVLSDICLQPQEVEDKYWYTDRPFQYNGDEARIQCTMLGKGFMRNTREVYNLNSKSATLLCDGGGGNRSKKVYQNGRVRKLTPLEYERLQNLPDNYTDCVSDSRRYTAVGNGWTVDVIAHIFSKFTEQMEK